MLGEARDGKRNSRMRSALETWTWRSIQDEDERNMKERGIRPQEVFLFSIRSAFIPFPSFLPHYIFTSFLLGGFFLSLFPFSSSFISFPTASFTSFPLFISRSLAAGAFLAGKKKNGKRIKRSRGSEKGGKGKERKIFCLARKERQKENNFRFLSAWRLLRYNILFFLSLANFISFIHYFLYQRYPYQRVWLQFHVANSFSFTVFPRKK